MRAWIEPDDDFVPMLSIEKTIGGKIVEGRYLIWFPLNWRIENIPEEFNE